MNPKTSCFPALVLHSPNFSLSLSLRFNGHFPVGPGLAVSRLSPFWMLLELRAMKVVVKTGATNRAKLYRYSKCHHQQTNTQSFFTGRMPFLSPNQRCQSTGRPKLLNEAEYHIF